MKLAYDRATQPGDIYLGEIEFLLKRRRDNEAETLARSGLDLHPENPRLWHVLGKTLRHDFGRGAETLQCFAKAYALDPQDKFSAMDYARFATKTGHFDVAEHVYARIYKDEGANIQLLSAIGSHYQKREMYGLAAACFGVSLTMAGADTYCHDRYIELSEKYDARFDTANLNKFQDRMAMLARTPMPANQPEPTLQPHG